MTTNTVRILIVEDEPIIAMDIESSLEKFGYSICAVTNEGRKAIDIAKKEKPDLILMDIQIEGALTGIETAKIIQMELSIPVMFLTSQVDPLTIKEAISAKPYGYIIKPFDEAELFANIELALFKKKTESSPKKKEMPESQSETLFVKEDKKIIQLKYSEIIYLESSENYVSIFTLKEKILIRSTFSEIENNLPTELFIRIHRSFIVRLQSIKSIHQDMVTMENGTSIPLGKAYKDFFMNTIQVFNQ